MTDLRREREKSFTSEKDFGIIMDEINLTVNFLK